MATYYVKNGGNDSADGLSDGNAWETISKVTSEWALGTFNPGDYILFNKGDTFYGTITITESGTSGNPITIGSYGTGNNPIITGFTTVTGWSVYSGSIYEATVSSAAQTNVVMVDGSQVGMGRYPNAGTNLSYTTATSNTIEDPGIGDSTDWEGAEILINKNAWTLDRCSITDHTGDVFTFSNVWTGVPYFGSTQTPDNNRYYFIQNDIRCVTEENEWYHSTSAGKLYIYGNPSSKTVKMATINYLIYNNGYDYITVEDLEFSGSIIGNIYCPSGVTNFTIQDCNINNAGIHGIYFGSGTDILIQNNEIAYNNTSGIFCYDMTSVDILSNYIHHISLIPGSGYGGTYSDGIYVGYGSPTDAYIQYNRIEYTGYNGIHFGAGTPFEARNNLITYSCQVIDDGGGIYYPSGGSITRIVDSNIVLNSGIGAPAWIYWARGIYADATASSSTITNNTVAGCREIGIHIHSGSGTTITGNTVYNNGRGIGFQKISSPSTSTVFNNNKIIATGTQYAFLQWGYNSTEMQNWGTFDYNYYARPSDDDYVFYYLSATHTLSEWKTLMSQDANSYGAPGVYADEDIHFIYNSTNDTKYYNVSATMVDITDTEYSGLISLDPWDSLVLLGEGTVTESEGEENYYYIDETGNDSTGDGSYSNPWRTLYHASTQVTNPGNTIYVRNGTYNEGANQIVKAVGVSILGEGYSTHIISSYYSSSSLQGAIHCASSAGTTTDDNSSISYIRLTGNSLTSSAGIFVGYRNNVTIHHCTIEDFMHRGIYFYVSSSYVTLFATGNSLHHCTINNSSNNELGFAGAIRISGQNGLQVYNNVIDMTERAAGSNGNSLNYYWSKGLKIYDNTFYRNDYEADQWNFFTEGWNYRGDVEYYNNTFYGLAKVSFGGDNNGIDAGCTWGVKCYGNQFLNDANGNRAYGGYNATIYAINIEGDKHEEVYVYNNYIQRFAWGIELSTATSGEGYWYLDWVWDGVYIYNNIIENIGYADWEYSYGIVMIMETDLDPYYGTYDNILIANNVMTGNNGGSYQGYVGIMANVDGTFNNVNICNNIIYDFYNNAVRIQEQGGATAVFNTVNITYNDLYSNGTDAVSWDANVEYTNRDILSGNITSNPLFVGGSPFSYELQSGSDCIDGGIDVGLTRDYRGYLVPYNTAPDIGSYEYGSYDPDAILAITGKVNKWGII